MLWQRLRGARAGAKFRRQHPIGPYVVDFYCREGRLVIEVDGEAHSRGDQPAKDVMRERFLKENGYQLMHIPAAEILRNIDGVANVIATRVAPPLHHAAHGPPPRAGEDQ